MFSNEDQETILRFIFSRESNVELALGIMSARQSISEKIIKDFLAKLEDELCLKTKQLGDSWKVCNDLKANPFERWMQIYITKQNWNDLYRISLEPLNMNARGFVLGVWNNWDTLGQRLDDEKIRAVLQGHVRNGSTNDWWPFYMSAAPYQNWIDERTLSLMWGNRGAQAISELTRAMVTIAVTTEKVIDIVVHNWLKKPSKASLSRG